MELSQADVARFWSKVDRRGEDECWLWLGAGVKDTRHDPRPRFWGGDRLWIAYRYSWMITYGEIPIGLYVCHNCPNGDNSLCCNPQHLCLGSAAQNNTDRHLKAAGKYHTGILTDSTTVDTQTISIQLYAIPNELPYTQKSLQRLYNKVKLVDSGCVEWQGAGDRHGYGQIRINTKNYQVTRVILELKLGRPIKIGYQACHTCDNPKCCNPEHLWEGSHRQNMQDAIVKNRAGYITHKDKFCVGFSGVNNPNNKYPEKIKRGDNHYARTNPEKLARGKKHGAYLHPEKWHKGSEVKTSKLTENDIRQIKRYYTANEFTITTLAKMFVVSYSTIYLIVNGKTWKHVL